VIREDAPPPADSAHRGCGTLELGGGLRGNSPWQRAKGRVPRHAWALHHINEKRLGGRKRLGTLTSWGTSWGTLPSTTSQVHHLTLRPHSAWTFLVLGDVAKYDKSSVLVLGDVAKYDKSSASSYLASALCLRPRRSQKLSRGWPARCPSAARCCGDDSSVENSCHDRHDAIRHTTSATYSWWSCVAGRDRGPVSPSRT
jgi:hypothetical protein